MQPPGEDKGNFFFRSDDFDLEKNNSIQLSLNLAFNP